MEKKKLLQEITQLEGKRNILKSAKPNLQDQQVLEQGKYVLCILMLFQSFISVVISLFCRKKLKLYKDLTKIQWDYEACMKHDIKGCILFFMCNVALYK